MVVLVVGVNELSHYLVLFIFSTQAVVGFVLGGFFRWYHFRFCFRLFIVCVLIIGAMNIHINNFFFLLSDIFALYFADNSRYFFVSGVSIDACVVCFPDDSIDDDDDHVRLWWRWR